MVAASHNETVFVVVVDYGLNGADVIGLFRSRPTDKMVKELLAKPFDGAKYGPTSVTGFSGYEVVEHEILP